MRLRLLPGLILAAGLALSLRLGDLWDGVVANHAQAQTAGGAAPANRLKAAASSKDSASTGSDRNPTAGRGSTQAPDQSATRPNLTPAAGDGGAPSDQEQAGTPGAADGAGGRVMPRDPLAMSDEEIDLLTALSQRRVELDRRARRVDEREALLQAAERRIDEKVQGLQDLQKSIEELLRRQDTQTEEQYKSLVKIYESMKPKDAARIFEELDMAVLLPVVQRMKERKTAPILAKMDPAKAKEITTELAQRKTPPEDTK